MRNLFTRIAGSETAESNWLKSGDLIVPEKWPSASSDFLPNRVRTNVPCWSLRATMLKSLFA
jgi:hypothetical protein